MYLSKVVIILFSTSIYRKKTFTGLYTKWDSFTPRKHKVNLIFSSSRLLQMNESIITLFNFTSLIIMVVPSQKRFKSIYYQSSLDALKKLLSQNGYPRGAVNYNMNDVFQKLQNKLLTLTVTVPKKKIFLVLPL